MFSLPAYAELHCLSNFSFLRGASHVGELVARAVRLGYAALAITDECSFAGSVRVHLAARDSGLQLIHGTELQLACGMTLVLLAQNRAGYGNFSALVARRVGRPTPAGWPSTSPAAPGSPSSVTCGPTITSAWRACIRPSCRPRR